MFLRWTQYVRSLETQSHLPWHWMSILSLSFSLSLSLSQQHPAGDSESRPPDRKQSASRKASYLSIEQDAESDDEKEAKQWTAKKLSVLPGQCRIEQTIDLSQDLDSLRSQFPKYQQLIARRLVSVGSEHHSSSATVTGPTIKVMQFKLSRDAMR